MEYGLDVGSDRLRLAVGGPTAEAVGAGGSTREVLGVDREGTAVTEPLEALLADREPGTIRYAVADGVETRTDVAETLEGLGFEPAAVSRGFAVVYDQLGADDHTGLGVCLGREATSVALAYYGVPVMAFSLPEGGEWIAERAAETTDRSVERVRRRLETFALDPEAKTDALDRALATAYDGLIAELLEAIREEAASAELGRGIAVPVAIGGEFAADGVEFLLGGRLDEGGLPFPIRGARLAEEPADSAARGALAAAKEGAADRDGELVESEGSSAAVEHTGDEPHAETVESLRGRVETLEREVDDFGSRDRTAELADELEGATAALAATEERLEAGETGIRELDATTAAIETELDELDGRIGTLESAREELTADVRGIETRLDETVEQVEGRLDETVEQAESGLDETAKRLDGLEARVEGRLGAVEDELAEGRERLEGIADDLGTTGDRLDAVERELETTAGRLEATESGFETVQERLEAVEEATVEANSGRGVVGPALAGAGGAGLLVGAAFAAAGSPAVGAGSVLLGAVSLAGAVRAGRR